MMRLLILILIAGMLLLGCAEEKRQVTNENTEAELHGVGTCDVCHDAPTVKDMAAGLHKSAFEKEPETHKPLCKRCHDVESFCSKCHEVPDVER